MHASRTRLDRFISEQCGINKRDVRLLLAQGRVQVDGINAVAIHQTIDPFSHVVLDGRILQFRRPIHLMLHKPVGVVSATRDDKHRTVIDLLDHPDRHQLHIVGRLDLNSSGLMLLTNDGRWSRQLTAPENKVAKVYRVTLANPIRLEQVSDYVATFAQGMYFPFEGITTRPARLNVLSEHEVEVTLEEGRYHQIKRMFGRFRNPVIGLHRLSIGALTLDATLMPGQSRELTAEELVLLTSSQDIKEDMPIRQEL